MVKECLQGMWATKQKRKKREKEQKEKVNMVLFIGEPFRLLSVGNELKPKTSGLVDRDSFSSLTFLSIASVPTSRKITVCSPVIDMGTPLSCLLCVNGSTVGLLGCGSHARGLLYVLVTFLHAPALCKIDCQSRSISEAPCGTQE